MNCEQCKDFISAFLDNDLDDTSSANVQEHLAICTECAKTCEDFAMILDFCVDEDAENIIPNSDALWCRINNIVESEIKPEVPELDEENNLGWFGNNWQLSFSQVMVSVLGIAIISSLITIIGIKNFSAPETNVATETTVSETIFTKVLGKFGLVETNDQIRERRIVERQKAIDYWTAKVAERRLKWDDQLRDTFDRNLKEVDQVVFEYHKITKENPQDKLSSEMLDSAMNEKMELLREFSEL